MNTYLKIFAFILLQSGVGFGLGVLGYHLLEDYLVNGNLMSDILYSYLAYCLFTWVGIIAIGYLQIKIISKQADFLNALLGASSAILLGSLLLGSLSKNILLLTISVALLGSISFNAGLYNWLKAPNREP